MNALLGPSHDLGRANVSEGPSSLNIVSFVIDLHLHTSKRTQLDEFGNQLQLGDSAVKNNSPSPALS